MNHEHYEKEFPNECIECDLKNITHLVYGKDTLIETTRVNDSLKWRIRSEKVHESAARTLNFSTHMGPAFEHTRVVGARASEQKLVEW